jgi:hypothetical protein
MQRRMKRRYEPDQQRDDRYPARGTLLLAGRHNHAACLSVD